MAIRVAINGAGRIGRAFYKLAVEHPEIKVIAVNDLGERENIEYLLRHDTVYGPWNGKFDVKFFQEKDPSKLPWEELDIDVVVESTGFFASYAGSKAHLDAGAKRAVVTAPMKDEPADGIEGGTVLMGINEDKLSTCLITSNASCTTNAGSPSKRGFREGRAAAKNIVRSSTGAAIAVTKAFTKLQGLFDGIAMRVPIVAGSIVDVTFIAKRETTSEEINSILKKAAGEKRWEGVFTVTEEELVSSDILGSTYGSIADLNMTRVVGGTLVKVVAWYDNEMGYAYTLVNHVIKLGQHIKHE